MDGIICKNQCAIWNDKYACKYIYEWFLKMIVVWIFMSLLSEVIWHISVI